MRMKRNLKGKKKEKNEYKQKKAFCTEGKINNFG